MSIADVYFTSSPYPIEVHEHLGATAGLTDGLVFPMLADSMDMTAVLTDGAMPVVVSYGAFSALEKIDVAAILTDGSMPVVVSYGSFSATTESIGVTASMTGGALVEVLIQNTMAPESIGTTAALTGGTLA